MTSRHLHRRNGTIFIASIWVLIALAGAAIVLAQTMMVETHCSFNQLDEARAFSVQQAAIQYVLAAVTDFDGRLDDDELEVEAVGVADGFFWIIRNSGLGGEIEFGITDETGKINLNAAPAFVLENLPGMTPDLASALLTWRGDGSEADQADTQYYLLRDPPYICKQSPFETVEELLLVRDFTPEMLFGRDINRNGIIDEHELRETSGLGTIGDEWLDRGLYPFVTVYSTGSGTGDDELLNVNSAQSERIHEVLESVLTDERLSTVAENTRNRRPFQNVVHYYLESGMTMDEFHEVAHLLTTGQNQRLQVNVNTAAAGVLQCLPGLDEADVAALLQWRATNSMNIQSVAWVTEVLGREKAIGIGEYITTTSWQYSADVLSVSATGRAMRRCRVVIDASREEPRIVYFQDATALGWPLEREILEEVKSGNLQQQAHQGFVGVR